VSLLKGEETVLRKRPVLIGAVGCALVLLGIVAAYRYRSVMACRQRGEEFRMRVELLKREARMKLKVGTKKEELVLFFADNGIPITFDSYGSASGTINTTGCAPFGCGRDSALIGVRVHVDGAGTVTSEPVVVGMYTDCL
jgi:hypothetical protein